MLSHIFSLGPFGSSAAPSPRAAALVFESFPARFVTALSPYPFHRQPRGQTVETFIQLNKVAKAPRYTCMVPECLFNDENIASIFAPGIVVSIAHMTSLLKRGTLLESIVKFPAGIPSIRLTR